MGNRQDIEISRVCVIICETFPIRFRTSTSECPISYLFNACPISEYLYEFITFLTGDKPHGHGIDILKIDKIQNESTRILKIQNTRNARIHIHTKFKDDSTIRDTIDPQKPETDRNKCIHTRMR